MALQKEILAKIGIPLSYHCVNSIFCLVNGCNIIEVTSYLNKEARREKIQKQFTDQDYSVYTETSYYNTDYNSNMDVIQAYEYLKTLSEFENAIDDDEEVYLSIKENTE